MTDINELRAWMARRGVTQGDCAKAIHVTERTFSTRMQTGIFDSDEIEGLVRFLKMDNPTAVFFPSWVNCKDTA